MSNDRFGRFQTSRYQPEDTLNQPESAYSKLHKCKGYFPSPQAALPVRLKSGGHVLLPWGRREGEAGALPIGGWARHESILVGKWDRFFS